MKTLASIAVVAAATVAAVPAQAEHEKAQLVHYGDLNLADSAGIAALQDRIRLAARRVCGAPEGPVLPEFQRVNNCRRIAYEKAIPQIQLALAEAKREQLAMLTVRAE